MILHNHLFYIVMIMQSQISKLNKILMLIFRVYNTGSTRISAWLIFIQSL